MKALTISDSENMVMALQDEIRRNDASRYDHRLHGVLLVAQGMSCPQVAHVLGDAPRTVVNWVRRFEDRGFSGLQEGTREGRPSRLNPKQFERLGQVLRKSPREVGIEAGLWDGPTLSVYLRQEFEIVLKVRQCQRLFRQMGFRHRKPRPQVAKADPEIQRTHKKTSSTGRKKGY